MSTFAIAALLFALLILSPSVLPVCLAESPTAAPIPPPGFCETKCGERCAKAGAQKRCLKDCAICCRACNCVPSGTYGNKSECPCYRDKMSSKGTPKCP